MDIKKNGSTAFLKGRSTFGVLFDRPVSARTVWTLIQKKGIEKTAASFLYPRYRWAIFLIPKMSALSSYPSLTVSPAAFNPISTKSISKIPTGRAIHALCTNPATI